MVDLALDLPSGGGGGAAVSSIPTQWPLFPNAGASVKSDNFPGSALNAKWTVWDELGTQTEAVADWILALTKNSTGGVDWSGVHQAVPGAASWSASVAVSLSCAMGGTVAAALIIAEDLVGAPTTADFKGVLLGANTTDTFVQYRAMTGQTNAGTSPAGASRLGALSSAYLRMRVAPASTAFEFSTDGIGWITLQQVALGWAAVRFGLAVWNQGGVTATARFRNFEVIEAATGLETMAGANIDLAYVP